jgi:hypothetical protein
LMIAERNRNVNRRILTRPLAGEVARRSFLRVTEGARPRAGCFRDQL